MLHYLDEAPIRTFFSVFLIMHIVSSADNCYCLDLSTTPMKEYEKKTIVDIGHFASLSYQDLDDFVTIANKNPSFKADFESLLIEKQKILCERKKYLMPYPRLLFGGMAITVLLYNALNAYTSWCTNGNDDDDKINAANVIVTTYASMLTAGSCCFVGNSVKRYHDIIHTNLLYMNYLKTKGLRIDDTQKA